MAAIKTWRHRLSPSLDDIEALAAHAFANLPEAFRRLCDHVIIAVADAPDQDVLDELGISSPFELLGVFQGVGLIQRGEVMTGLLPNKVTLFRRPILDYWTEHEIPIGRLVTHVLVHEIGHHFGLSDADLDAIEKKAA